MYNTEARNPLALARAARAVALAGKTPRQRGDEKMRLALDWIYRWGWASPSTLDLLAGTAGRGLGSRLVKRGLLVKTRSEAAGGEKGVPVWILTLSRRGLEEVERVRSTLLPYQLDPSEVAKGELRRHQLAQLETAKGLLKEGFLRGYLTTKELAVTVEPGRKLPDVVWLQRNGMTMAVELELSARWGRDLDDFVDSVVHAVSGSYPQYDLVAIVTDSPAIAARCQAALRPGATYQVWERNAKRTWVAAGARTVPERLEGRVACRLLSP